MYHGFDLVNRPFGEKLKKNFAPKAFAKYQPGFGVPDYLLLQHTFCNLHNSFEEYCLTHSNLMWHTLIEVCRIKQSSVDSAHMLWMSQSAFSVQVYFCSRDFSVNFSSTGRSLVWQLTNGRSWFNSVNIWDDFLQFAKSSTRQVGKIGPNDRRTNLDGGLALWSHKQTAGIELLVFQFAISTLYLYFYNAIYTIFFCFVPSC